MDRTRWDLGPTVLSVGLLLVALVAVAVGLARGTLPSETLPLLGLIGALVGYRLLDRRLDERPSGLLTVVVTIAAGVLLHTFGSEALGADIIVPLALLGLVGTAQVVGSYVSVSTRAFGALTLAVAVGMATLELTLFDSGRSLIGAVLIGLLGLLCLLRPEAIERASETSE